MEKVRVGVVFGGKSSEHAISLQSAKNIISAIDKKKFDVSIIGIDKKGNWTLYDSVAHIENNNNPQVMRSQDPGKNIVSLSDQAKHPLAAFHEKSMKIDVIFPIVHGAQGEDGTLQGLLNLANMPFVGSDVLSSAICMDKDITKKLLRSAGLEVAPYMSIFQHARSAISFSAAKEKLGTPLFIKPANQGSSIGVSQVSSENEYKEALNLAFEYSEKVLIEQAIYGKEIECAVLGNEDPKASICGEIAVPGSFYSYQKKYLDTAAAKIYIPARISAQASETIRSVALQAFKALECSGMARVDVFLTADSKVIINEINTLPGFTDISMYPKLWQASGIDYPELISRLIELALARNACRRKLRLSV